jgi:hypothetical protein
VSKADPDIDWVFQTALFSTIGALSTPVFAVYGGEIQAPALRVVVDSKFRLKEQ